MTSPPAAAMQRVSPAAALPAVLAALGVDAGPIFQGLSFGPQDLVADAQVPFNEALIMGERAARLAGRPELGVMVGVRNDHRCLGVVGQLMASAPTLGEALADYVSVQGGLSRAASAYLVPMGDCLALGFGVYDRLAEGVDQIYGMAMGAGANMVRSLSGGVAQPLEVHFSYRAPSDPAAFEKLLRVPVRFNQPQTCVLFSRAAAATPNPSADAALRAQLKASLRAMLRLDERPMADRLRHELRPALSMGDTSLSAAARRLGLSARSLDRRLAEEGTTFARERDAVRFVMACELLALTDLSVGDIALALSYATHSAFVRSFKRWSGLSPSIWRGRNQTSGAGG